MSRTDRLEQLLDAWCDGTASDEEAAEFGQRLAGDLRAARQAARRFTLEDGLRECCTRPVAALAARRASSRRSSWWPLAAASAASLLLGMWWWRSGDPADDGTRPHLTGEAVVDDLPWDGRAPLPPGSLVSARSALVMAYPDGSRLDIAAGSRLRLDAVGPEAGGLLMDGRIQAQVAHRPAGHPLVLRTGEARIEVLGTRFSLERTHGRTDLQVTEGRVRFTRVVDGSSEEVTAGGSTHAHWSSLHGTLVSWQASWDWRLDAAGDEAWLRGAGPLDGWERGPAPIGCDNDRVTAWGTRVPTRAQQRAPLLFRARHAFTLAEGAMPDRLHLRIEVDDGAVVWLNGRECLRLNLPAGPLSAGASALMRVTGGYLEHTCAVDPTLLQPGANVIAAQVHQYGQRSGDLAFALELVAP